MNLHIESRRRWSEKIKDRAEAKYQDALEHFEAADGKDTELYMDTIPAPNTRRLEAIMKQRLVKEGTGLYHANQTLKRAARVLARAKRIFKRWDKLSWDDTRRY